MTIIEELSAALIKADAAGNAADAKVLADAIRQMQPQAAVESTQPLASGMSAGVLAESFKPIQSGPSTDFGVGQRQESPLAIASEGLTGEQRKTEASQFFPDWRNNLPEFSLTKGPSTVKAVKVAAATMTASPEETAKIVKANYPDVNVLQDDKGNYFFESGIDKKIYAIPPGFGATDIPRAVVAGAMFAPAAGAATAAGRIVGAGLTQAGIEAGQAAVGGEFNAADIPITAATQGAFEAYAARNAIKQSVGELLGGLLEKEKAAMPSRYVSPTGEAASTVPANIAAEMGGSISREAPSAPQFISPTEKSAMQPPAAMQAEMGGALPRPPQSAPVAPTEVAAPLNAAERVRAGIMDEAELGELLRKASSNEIGSTKAKEELATLIGEDPRLKETFGRLGIEPTIDWLSDNQQVRAAIGLTRSKVGSAAESEYLQTLRGATEKVDALMASIDGSKDISSVSENVKRKMVSTMQSLKRDANEIYNQVNQKVPQTTKVELSNTKSHLDQVKANLGGKETSLHKEERRLASIISAGDISYGTLKREKDLVFKALQKQESPYGSMVESDLKQLYSALSKDQIENVSRVAGAEEGVKLRGANFLWAKNRAMGERITSIFGKDESRSVAALMQSAIKTGAKGDITALNKLLKTIPQEDAALRKSVVATAINDLSLSKTGNNAGNFNFQKFADAWDGIRRNSEVLRVVSREIGPEATSMLQDLYAASKVVAESQTNVKHTGKANQILSDALNAEGFFTKALSTTAGKATTAVGGALLGGPIGAGAGVAIQNLISKGSKEGVKRAGDLLSDPAFKALIREMAQTGKVSVRARNRLNISKAYNRFREYMPRRPLTVPPTAPSITPQQESQQ
jgi:hypothetical protein